MTLKIGDGQKIKEMLTKSDDLNGRTINKLRSRNAEALDHKKENKDYRVRQDIKQKKQGKNSQHG